MRGPDGKAPENTQRTAPPGRVARYQARSNDADTRGGVGSGAVVGAVNRQDGKGSDAAPTGDVRPRIEDLRRTAELVRAIEPWGYRRFTIILARAIGWGLADVERLTLGEAYWLSTQITEGLARANAKPARRVRYGTR